MNTELTSSLLALVDDARAKLWAEYCRCKASEVLEMLEWGQEIPDDAHERYRRAANMVGLSKDIAYHPMFSMHYEVKQRALLALNGKPWPSLGGGNGTGPANA